MLRASANFLIFSFALVVLLCLGDVVSAQPSGGFGRAQGRSGGRGPGFGPGGGIPGMGTVELLRQDAVRKELELLDDQVANLEKLGEEIREMMRDAISRFREGRESDQAGGPPDMRQLIQSVQTRSQARLGEILLPHQMKRLQQLAMQARLRGGGFAMLSPEVGEQLGINEQQREQLREKAQGIEADLRKKIAELRRQAQDELIALLTPEQQAKYRELLGEPFEFPAPQRPQRRPQEGGGPRETPRR
jgi:hypothetical protein